MSHLSKLEHLYLFKLLTSSELNFPTGRSMQMIACLNCVGRTSAEERAALYDMDCKSDRTFWKRRTLPWESYFTARAKCRPPPANGLASCFSNSQCGGPPFWIICGLDTRTDLYIPPLWQIHFTCACPICVSAKHFCLLYTPLLVFERI